MYLGCQVGREPGPSEDSSPGSLNDVTFAGILVTPGQWRSTCRAITRLDLADQELAHTSKTRGAGDEIDVDEGGQDVRRLECA
jgi:hypothetical protein